MSDRLLVITGWTASVLGFGLWVYGYCVSGTPSLIAWTSVLPTWASAWLPNREAEIGMVLSMLGSLLPYTSMWRSR